MARISDQHKQIRCFLRKEYPEICHQFDIWPEICHQFDIWPEICHQFDIWPEICHQFDIWPEICHQFDLRTRDLQEPEIYKNQRFTRTRDLQEPEIYKNQRFTRTRDLQEPEIYKNQRFTTLDPSCYQSFLVELRNLQWRCWSAKRQMDQYLAPHP